MCEGQSKPGVWFACGGGCKYSVLGVCVCERCIYQWEMKEDQADLLKAVKQGQQA